MNNSEEQIAIELEQRRLLRHRKHARESWRRNKPKRILREIAAEESGVIQQTPKNRREKSIAEQYIADGWEVIHKGWPDFLMYKDGKIKLIEVKRKQVRPTKKMGLSKHQARVREILSKHHDYTVEYVD